MLDPASLVAAVTHVTHERLATPFVGLSGRQALVLALPSDTPLDDPIVVADDLVVVSIVIDTTTAPGDELALVSAGGDGGGAA